jgi:hypothetical protein
MEGARDGSGTLGLRELSLDPSLREEGLGRD